MKKSLLFILLFLLFWGCSHSEKSDDAKQPAAVAKAETLATGDLLFVGIPGDYNLEGISSAIADATGYGDTNFIHTAIIEVDGDGQAWIIDATLKRGVARYPIDTFLTDFTLNDGSLPTPPVAAGSSPTPRASSANPTTPISPPTTTSTTAPNSSMTLTSATGNTSSPPAP